MKPCSEYVVSAFNDGDCHIGFVSILDGRIIYFLVVVIVVLALWLWRFWRFWSCLNFFGWMSSTSVIAARFVFCFYFLCFLRYCSIISFSRRFCLSAVWAIQFRIFRIVYVTRNLIFVSSRFRLCTWWLVWRAIVEMYALSNGWLSV